MEVAVQAASCLKLVAWPMAEAVKTWGRSGERDEAGRGHTAVPRRRATKLPIPMLAAGGGEDDGLR